MENSNFPIFKTKISGQSQRFNLADSVERRKYFELKAGPEIEKLRLYLEHNTFIAYLLGKKNSGKGTYTKLFAEVIGPEHVAHISIGDIIRDTHKSLSGEAQKEEFMQFLEKNYRGFLPIDKATDALLGRDLVTLLPTEFVLALLKREISLKGRKTLFIDGFPRNLDQISYSLFFRDLIGYRDDPDFFIFIDVPMSVIDERMRYRVICPKCFTPRNPKLLTTKEVGYDKERKEFFLICDNPACGPHRLVAKEGDALGIEAIRDRLEADENVMAKLLGLQGVPKIFLRNSLPVKTAREYVDDYEITPAYSYSYNEKTGKVITHEAPWVIKDDNGEPSYGLLPPAMTLAMIKQITQTLGL